MRLSKYQHSCMVIEKNGQNLVIDPGNYSDDFITPTNVVAVIVTHKHADHADPERLAEIFAENPSALLIGPADALAGISYNHKKIVGPDQTLSVAPFNFRFCGGKHAVIHSSLGAVENVGVIVDDVFYYPGDSFAHPIGIEIETLALPVAAPWMKIGEAIDFFTAIKPRFAFPTHDAIYSAYGQALADKLINAVATEIGNEYRRIDGETIDLAGHRQLD